jgi:hypothetical protein
MLCVWELVMIPDTMLARMLLLGCWQKCQMQQQPSKAKAVKNGVPWVLQLGPLGPSKQKKFLAVDLCETYKNESKSGTFGDPGLYFISQFCNIENLAEFTPAKKKKRQIYTTKNIHFFGVKK